MAGTVVISGASTGIGRATALHLKGLGFDVLAGVRREGDAPEGTTPVLLDVTDPVAIDLLAQRIGGGPLAGLVNNAGIGIGGPVEHIPLDDWRAQFEVNLFGHVAMTRALLPALLAGHGRIVNMGSIGGRQALPLVSPYSASKFAMHGFSDSLRLELRRQGVHVALVEPGAIATEIWRKADESFEAIESDLPADIAARYRRELDGARKASDRAARHAIAADKVAATVGHALTARRPRARYVVGADARGQALIERLPAAARDRLLRLAFGI
jgi:NAD(P)-dependent dehydrogenase (short-subunit alcohol dehydrogenase family)